MKDLGCMNGWSAIVWTKADGSKFVEKEDTTPEEYKECVRKRHMSGNHIVSVKLGNCYYKCYCKICKIEYTVDSSD